MPQFTKEIPEVEDTVTRPVILEVVTKLLQTMRNETPYQLRFLNDADSLITKGSAIDEDPNKVARLPADNYIKIEVDELYDENSNRTTQTGNFGEMPVFRDTQTKTNMNPIYQQVVFQIRITYTSGDRARAESFRRRYRSMISNSINGMAFKIPYFYFIPFEFMAVLNDIYTLKEKVAGYGDTLGAWLRQSFVSNIDAKQSNAGKGCLAICEQAQNVLVLMDDNEEVAQKERNNDSTSWTVDIPIKVYFDRPELMRMSFPNLVHNQLVDNNYLSKYRAYRTEQEQANMSFKTQALTRWNPGGYNPKTQLAGVADPLFDDWLVGYKLDGYQPLLRILVNLNPDDLTELVTLTDLANWQLSDSMISWLKQTRRTIGEDYGNIIVAKPFIWDTLRNSELLTMDENLKINFGETLNLRNVHHVTLYICNDPSLLKESVWIELGKNPDFLKDYLDLIDPRLGDYVKDHVVTDGNGNSIVPKDAINGLQNDLYENFNTRGMTRQVMKTVMLYDVVVKPRT